MNQRKIGVLLNYISQLIQLLTGLFYMPVMLRILGQSEYGLYQLAFSVVSYLGILSLGLNGAYNRFYFRYKSKDDSAGISKLNALFILIFGIIAGICMIAGSVMVIYADKLLGNKIAVAEISTAKILISILVINLAITFVGTVFDCYLSANECFVFQKSITILQGLFGPLVTLPLLLLGYGSIGMVSVTTSLTVLRYLVDIVYCRKKLLFSLDFSQLDWKLIKEFWGFAVFIILSQLVDIINWNLDNFILGRMMGTIAVAIYGVGSQINNLYMQMSTAISSVFAPQINRIVNDKSNNVRELLSKLFIRVGRIQFMVLSSVIIEFLIWGDAFIRIWAGDDYSQSYWIALILIVSVTISLIQNIGIEIQFAMNKHRMRSIVYSIIAVLNIVLSIMLVKRIGIIGVAIGTSVAMICGNGLFMNWYYEKEIGLDIIAFWKNIFSFCPVWLGTVLFSMLLRRFMKYDSILYLLISMFITLIIYVTLLYLWGINDEERTEINKTMDNLKIRVKK